MFAIIQTGGKQYLVKEGEVVTIEKLPEVKSGQDISFDKVLLTYDGATTSVGTPFISGATVQAKIIEEGRAKKIEVVKYKAKSRYFKLRGHRQPFMKVQIASV